MDLNKIDQVINNINKEFGKGSIRCMENTEVEAIPIIPSGSLALDAALGVGGYPIGRVIELYGGESSGKAQPLTSKILTPQGWRLMGDMRPGSVICAPDGTNTTVVGIFPQGVQSVYRITFDDKSTTECTLDHLWAVSTRKSTLQQIKTTQELIDEGLISKNKGSSVRKFKIPTTQPLQFTTNNNVPIDPYFLGLLLGDGTLRDSVVYSTLDEELHTFVANHLDEHYQMSLSEKRNVCDYGFRKNIHGRAKNGVVIALEELNLYPNKSENKFIPQQYLYSTIENRIALFQGLIDTDGHVYKDQHSIQFVTVSSQLADDFVELARSLGMRCVRSSRVGTYTAASGEKISGQEAHYINCLHGDFFFQPGRLTRKQMTPSKSSYADRWIESIEYVREEECQCIKVGHPDSLYITDNHVVTHNTTLVLHAIVEAQNQGKVAAFIDVEHAFDKNYAMALGIDMNRLYVCQPDNAEQALEIMDRLVQSGEFAVVALDSVAALVSKKEFDGEMGDASMGVIARLMSQAMRKLTGSISKKNVTAFFINQTREKIGVMFGNPTTTTGGNALKFYASIRLEVSKGQQVKDGDEVTANKTKVKVVKNKVAPPYRIAEFQVEFGVGIDKPAEILELAVENGIIQKGGSWYSYQDSKLGQGAANVVTTLKDNPELLEEIEAQVRAIYIPVEMSKEEVEPHVEKT